MENRELVSIIMPAHNAAKFISDSIESVLAQTYSFWELLIVNDRSSDETRSIVEKYTMQDKRITLIDNSSDNSGAYHARNIALDHADGTYIAFLDSDDLWMPEKLSTQISEMKLNGYSVSHTAYNRINENGKHLNSVSVKEVVNYKHQLKSNRIPNLTGIYDCNVIDIIHQRNIGHEDYDMWLKIVNQSPSFGINKPLAEYRVVSNSLSSNKLKAALWHYKILKEQSGIGFLKRSNYFIQYLLNALLKRF